jgi:hypothetical protein
MHKYRREKHAGTDLNTAADTQLANTQGSSSEAGHNATITKPVVEDKDKDYTPKLPGITPDELVEDEDREKADSDLTRD